MSNKKYWIKKIASLLATILLISVLSFIAFSVIPGDAATIKLGTGATSEQLESLREEMGLNENVVVRYCKWISGLFTGDLGDSFYYNKPVGELIAGPLATTFLLTFLAALMVIIIALPLAVLSAKKPGKALDTILQTICKFLMAIPPFFMGLLVSLVFGLLLKLFELGGYVSPSKNFFGSLYFLLFPAFSIALPKACMTASFLREGLAGEMNKDYVRTLRYYGFSDTYILLKHALKNALLPTITFYGIVVAEMLAGSVIVEQIFGVKGMGRMLLQSVGTRDLPVMQIIVFIIGVSVVIINFITDCLYRVIQHNHNN